LLLKKLSRCHKSLQRLSSFCSLFASFILFLNHERLHP
uniref:Ovule protein n=1 Tax=Haemonchus placei TaxID=6290 RepID=A0A0N4VSD4_HAEPC